MTNRLYLIGSPTEFGDEVYLESHETWLNCGNGVAVYAHIDNPSPETMALVGQQVATSWHQSWVERWKGDYTQAAPTPEIGEALKDYINWT